MTIASFFKWKENECESEGYEAQRKLKKKSRLEMKKPGYKRKSLLD